MTPYSHEYDPTYHPAMPVVEIQVISLEDPTQTASLVAIVDSGADITFVPVQVLRRLSVESLRRVSVKGIDGLSYTVDMYLVKLIIGSYEFFGVRVVGDEQNQTILGRNVLNELVVTLNGLAHVVEVSQG